MMEKLTTLKEEMCEMSYRVERLESAMPSEGESSSSTGSEWAWWNGAWRIRTGSRMNSTGKRRVSRAVHQAMSRQGERIRTDMTRFMAYVNEAKMEHVSDNDRELALQQASIMQTEDAWDIDREGTARRARGWQLASTRNKATSSASACVRGARGWPRTPVGQDLQHVNLTSFQPGMFH